MKCIVIQTSPERINAEPVTNEDGTPYIYATMAEARAELKANGYIYNRANQRYYINGTEYRAYILRADSEEYAEIITEQAHEAAARQLISAYAEAIGDAVTEDDPEAVAAYQVAREAIGYTTATDQQRATVDAMVQAIADRATQDADQEPAPVYQRAELEAFLGEYVDAYDVDAIEAEATTYDPRTGHDVWTPEAVRDLAAIAERHEISA